MLKKKKAGYFPPFLYDRLRFVVPLTIFTVKTAGIL